jgi:hypothetical protein
VGVKVVAVGSKRGWLRESVKEVKLLNSELLAGWYWSRPELMDELYRVRCSL